MQKILIFGNGWLGNKFRDYFSAKISDVDITDKKQVEGELDRLKPEVVINAVGVTGKPNVDWCEEHKLETVDGNITGPLILLKACLNRGILLVHLSSGCIFSGASSGPDGFSEEDEPMPLSFYSFTKAKIDEILKNFPVLILRLRLPVDSIPHPKNLITKLVNYPKVADVKNSITIISDLLFAAKKLIKKKRTGIYHIVNPGPIKFKDFMELYKKIVAPSHKYELIEPEELLEQGLVKTGRSHCVLDAKKLEREGIKLEDAIEGIKKCLLEYKKYL